jgi:hypothetical protein
VPWLRHVRDSAQQRGNRDLQSTGYFHVDNRAASTLEAFKDITIAVASFALASHLPRFGIRRSMVAALLIAGLGCVAVPLGDPSGRCG